MALLSHQSMVVAPLVYPCRKISQPIEAEARGPPELLLYVQHVIHWAPFLDAQCLLLVGEEVCEEFVLLLYQLCLLICSRSFLHPTLWYLVANHAGSRGKVLGQPPG